MRKIFSVDITTPTDVIKKFETLNFPFIYRKVEVKESMVCEKMLEMAKSEGRKFPYETNSLTWSGQGLILATTLIQFYISIGMEIKRIHFAVKYQPGKPFKEFVDSLVATRVQAEEESNKGLSNRCKFTMNR